MPRNPHGYFRWDWNQVLKEATGKTIRAVKRCFLIRLILNIEIREDQILVGLVKDLCVTRRNRRRTKVQRLAKVEFRPQVNQMTLLEKEVKQFVLHPLPSTSISSYVLSPLSLISPVPLPFSNSLIVALPCSNMEPSPNKAKQDLGNLAQDDAEAIRKLMATFEKHLKLKNQSQAAVEQKLKMVKEVVKRKPTLRILVKRIAISVSHCWRKNLPCTLSPFPVWFSLSLYLLQIFFSSPFLTLTWNRLQKNQAGSAQPHLGGRTCYS